MAADKSRELTAPSGVDGPPASLPRGLLLSFYGDDFTGSTDSMEALARGGLNTLLFLEPPGEEELSRFPEAQAIGVAGRSRSLSPSRMDEELFPVFEAMRKLPAPIFHLKVCSTFDSSPEVGSIGHTIDLAQPLFNSPFVPVIVGAPILNRFCVFGNLFARSGPESELFRLDRHPTMSRHPVTPMTESDLRLHLARQTTRTIGHIDVLDLESTPERIRDHLNARIQSGSQIILFDTLSEAHLATIGSLLWENRALGNTSRKSPLFVVGSSGVEYALTAFWRSRGWLGAPPRFTAESVDQLLVFSGSCSPVTARQIEWATAHGFAEVPLNASKLARATPEAEQEIATALRSALAKWNRGRSVILHTCCGPDDPRLLSSAGQTDGQAWRSRLGKSLGTLLEAFLAATAVQRVVVAGGDTSSEVAHSLRSMGALALQVQKPIAPGSPLCRIVASNVRLNGMEMLFKGGQVGELDLFGSVLKGSL